MLVRLFNAVKVESVPLKSGRFLAAECGGYDAKLQLIRAIRHTHSDKLPPAASARLNSIRFQVTFK
jgi:hypothetical protein